VPIENLNFEGLLALPLSPYPTLKWLSGHGSTARERATARGRAEILFGAKKRDSPLVMKLWERERDYGQESFSIPIHTAIHTIILATIHRPTHVLQTVSNVGTVLADPQPSTHNEREKTTAEGSLPTDASKVARAY
jgi:hypothetical protein